MKLLLDQGLPRSTAFHFRNAEIEAVHVGELGLSTASDSRILDFASQQAMVVVTLDADFHALLALSGAKWPSVIRVRIEGLRGEELAALLINVLKVCSANLGRGAVVSVTENGVRIRRCHCYEFAVLNLISAPSFPAAAPESIEFAASGRAAAR